MSWIAQPTTLGRLAMHVRSSRGNVVSQSVQRRWSLRAAATTQNMLPKVTGI